jgi:hypothetical protein
MSVQLHMGAEGRPSAVGRAAAWPSAGGGRKMGCLNGFEFI